MPINDTHKFLFVHIPKTGGTSIEQMLDLKHRENLFSEIDALQHLIPSELRKRLDPKYFTKEYFKFTFVRNPFSRMISEYTWRQLIQKDSPMDFYEFLLWVSKIVKRKGYNENVYYNHFIPQVDYFEDIEYDFVGRFENFESDLTKVLKRLGVEKKIPHKQRTSRSLPYQAYYTKKTRELVEEIYKDDLKMFDYVF